MEGAMHVGMEGATEQFKEGGMAGLWERWRD